MYIFSACLAHDLVNILLPKQTSLWVANGKARQVTFAYDGEEADKWLMEILDHTGDTVHSYSADILFPEKRGGKMIYEKHVIVPVALKGGQHKLRICGWLKDKKKICKETDAFQIEGDQLKCESPALVFRPFPSLFPSLSLSFRTTRRSVQARYTPRSAIRYTHEVLYAIPNGLGVDKF